MNRKGLGKGLGMGYKNIAPMDAHIHSLSAKGMKTKLCPCKTVKKVFNLNGYSRGNMHTIRLDPEYSIITYSEGTRNGFRHVAILMRNGYEQDKATVNYLNRTWESYDFQTVIHKLLDKSFDENKAKILKTDLDTKRGSSLMAKAKKVNWDMVVAEYQDRLRDYGEPENTFSWVKKTNKGNKELMALEYQDMLRNYGEPETTFSWVQKNCLMAKGKKGWKKIELKPKNDGDFQNFLTYKKGRLEVEVTRYFDEDKGRYDNYYSVFRQIESPKGDSWDGDEMGTFKSLKKAKQFAKDLTVDFDKDPDYKELFKSKVKK